MNNLQAHLAKIRTDAAECLLLSTLATDKKGQMFAKMAEHLNGLALELEKTIAASGSHATQAELHRTSSSSATVDHEEAAAIEVATAVDAAGTDPEALRPQPVTRSRRLIPWLLLVVVAAVAGSLLWANVPPDWANEHITRYSSLFAGPSRNKPAPSRDDSKTMADLLAGEQRQRKELLEQLSALAARIKHLEGRFDDLKGPSAHVVGPPANEVSPTEGKLAVPSRPSALEQKPSVREGDITFTVEKQTERPSESVPSTSGSPPAEPAARIGTNAAPEEAAQDGPSPTIGPRGCERFRSYDAASGTYVTFNGRRRQCRQP